MAQTYRFSGHESFPCKTLWLKKGYDFIANGKDFTQVSDLDFEVEFIV